jgi:serine/arginine repetitive matrix protein 2
VGDSVKAAPKLDTAAASASASANANGTAKAGGPTALARGKSNRAELENTEEERRRKLRMEAQEEKIPVEDPVEDTIVGVKGDNVDRPQMSATSYPGQEWNPYMMGAYEDDVE